ncbi:MAG: hypothetical protein Q8J89_02015 [Caulobacter sp.]|nr:hypothetical protein [Caulobacter sp.]
MPSAWHTLGRGAMGVRPGYAPETAAYLDYIESQGVPADATRSALLDAFIGGLAADGVLTRLDALYLLIGHADLATRVNIVSPGAYTLTKVNSPLFTADGGWADNGGAGYLDSGFNISSASGRKYAQNDAGIGGAVLGGSTSAAAFIGAGANALIVASTGLAMRSRLNQGSNNDLSGFTTPKAVMGVDRTGSNLGQRYRAGTAQTAFTTASAAPTNDTFKVLTNNGSAFSGQTVGLAWVGQSVGAAGQAALRSRYVVFATALGLTPE